MSLDVPLTGTPEELAATPQTTSAKGRKFIKRHEGLSLKAYLDPVGIWTIGWGHTKNVKKGDEITIEQAEQFLTEDLFPAEKAVADFIAAPLNQDQFDALVSFTFNVGGKALMESTLRRYLNKGDYYSVPGQLSRWNKGRVGGILTVLPGLTIRREEEGLLFQGKLTLK